MPVESHNQASNSIRRGIIFNPALITTGAISIRRRIHQACGVEYIWPRLVINNQAKQELERGRIGEISEPEAFCFERTMASFAIPLIVVTALWAIVGAGFPWLVPKGPNRGIIQVMLVLTAVCCYMFWLMAFLHQLNPLLGPELEVATLIWLNRTWGHSEYYQENTESG